MNGSADDPHRYDNMLDLPHHVSRTHPQMPPDNRAAQFAPFAALTGYEEAVNETARLTDRKIELDNDRKLMLNEKLQMLRDSVKTRPEATLVYFRPDEKKDGGEYVAVTGSVKKVDEYERLIVLTSGARIPIDDISDIDGELFRGMDEWLE